MNNPINSEKGFFEELHDNNTSGSKDITKEVSEALSLDQKMQAWLNTIINSLGQYLSPAQMKQAMQTIMMLLCLQQAGYSQNVNQGLQHDSHDDMPLTMNDHSVSHTTFFEGSHPPVVPFHHQHNETTLSFSTRNELMDAMKQNPDLFHPGKQEPYSMVIDLAYGPDDEDSTLYLGKRHIKQLEKKGLNTHDMDASEIVTELKKIRGDTVTNPHEFKDISVQQGSLYNYQRHKVGFSFLSYQPYWQNYVAAYNGSYGPFESEVALGLSQLGGDNYLTIQGKVGVDIYRILSTEGWKSGFRQKTPHYSIVGASPRVRKGHHEAAKHSLCITPKFTVGVGATNYGNAFLPFIYGDLGVSFQIANRENHTIYPFSLEAGANPYLGHFPDNVQNRYSQFNGSLMLYIGVKYDLHNTDWKQGNKKKTIPRIDMASND